MKRNLKKAITPTAIIGVLILGLYSFTLLYSLFWAAITSLKTAKEFGTLVSGNIFGFPKDWRFDNYPKAFNLLYIQVTKMGKAPQNVHMAKMFLNSCLYTFVSAFIFIFTRMLVAYAVARYKFIGRNVIYTTVIVTMVIPIIGSLASEIQMMHNLNLYDTLYGVYIMKAGFTGVNFLVLYAAFRSVPDTYSEAAQIDGAGHFAIMFTIIVPLIKTTFFALYIVTFIQFWNEYTTQMIYLPSMPVLAYGLYRFQFSTSNYASIPLFMSACMMVSLPIIIVFIIFRNMIMGNISVGGIKG